MGQTIKKLFGLLTPRERTQLLLLFIAQVFMAVLDTAGIASIMPFMAVVANPGIIKSNHWLNFTYTYFNFSTIPGFLFFLCLLVLGLLVFGNAFKALYCWLTLKFDNRLIYTLARRLLAAYMTRPYEFFLNRNTSEMGKNILVETRSVVVNILNPGMLTLSNSLIAIFILTLLVIVNPLATLLIAGVVGGSYTLVYALSRRRLAKLGKEQFEANTNKYKAASEALAGIKDLKILGREIDFLKTFAGFTQRHAISNVSAGVISQLPRYALESIAFGGILMAVLLSLGADQKLSQMIPLLALYAFSGYRLMPALQIIFASSSNLRFNQPSLEILCKDINQTRQADPEAELIHRQTVKPLIFTRELALENVFYSYPGVQESAIKDVSLTIAPNTTIGFIGPTGSGKTTIVDIILGLLAQSSGRIVADGTEICGDTIFRWQRNLGYVPQHIYLCDDTIAKNIAFGVPEKQIDMDAITKACHIANLFDFITNELPEGFNTVIGERGIRLSGGQRQRIGIARALYRDPAVLIMDEATSALDGITEELVMDALKTLSGKKTVILIAHRLTTVKDCNVIYLLEHGKITAQGTYDELIKTSGWFQAAARI